MTEGTVKWFDKKKGYGFIAHTDGDDVFVHYTGFASSDLRTLNEGQTVCFDIVEGEKGLRADKVSVKADAQQTDEDAPKVDAQQDDEDVPQVAAQQSDEDAPQVDAQQDDEDAQQVDAQQDDEDAPDPAEGDLQPGTVDSET